MSDAPPRISVELPDGQTVEGRCHARAQNERGQWRYHVGWAAWQNVGDQGDVRAAEYRVWLTTDEAHPIPGEDYSRVPTKRAGPAAPPPLPKWAFAVQRLTNRRGGTVGTVVHEYDCEDSPGGPTELDVTQALDALERPGARACQKCDAAQVLLPALGKQSGEE
ncbi:DUF6233 domain-containing protein [Streptomyces sp. BH055]|uniref:DUF6233 domain-containing protein n=1 Tax=unclassified Streptomyces TaxID=2593676 RepID=UPI003BB7B512